ncbi:MAG: cytochrome P450 [Gammaproteobacteria bacterium]
MSTATDIPAHVPASLVRDVDIYDLPGCGQDVHLAWKRLQDESPAALVYTPRNGGHWIATRGDAVWDLFGDIETFSAKEISVPRHTTVYPNIPNQSDEPEHAYYRAIVTRFLTPKVVYTVSEEVRRLAISLIEGFRNRGRCEFVAEFARHLPMTIFLKLVNLPLEDRPYLMSLADVAVRSGDAAARIDAGRRMHAYLEKWVAERTVQPGNDLLSAIIHGRVGDRPMTREEIFGECSDVMFGGLDTVANMMGFVAHFLATHPAHRRQLIDAPERIPQAVEEMLRRFAVASPCRLVPRDVVFHGVQLKAGDMVVIASPLHGMDERIWPDPLQVDFDRDVRLHATFGNGVHRCPGANLARSEIRIFIEEWLRRIPDFEVETGARVAGQSGLVSGMTALPLAWPV